MLGADKLKCSKCKESKITDDFGKNKSTPTGFDFYCKLCRNAWRKSRRHLWNSEKNFYIKNPNYRRNYKLLKEYGISVDDYEILLRNQKGVCAICNLESSTRLHVDHCHTTGEIRGLLCNNCNAGIGFLKDDVSILKSAIVYLRKE